MVRKSLFVLALLTLLVGCKGEAEKSKSEIGKYVYLDKYRIIHVDRKCNKIFKRVERIQVKGKLLGNYYYCPKCVSDEAYDSLTN